MNLLLERNPEMYSHVLACAANIKKDAACMPELYDAASATLLTMLQADTPAVEAAPAMVQIEIKPTLTPEAPVITDVELKI